MLSLCFLPQPTIVRASKGTIRNTSLLLLFVSFAIKYPFLTRVGRVKGESVEWTVADGNPGAVTMRLREELIGIQYGDRPDPFNWIHKVC